MQRIELRCHPGRAQRVRPTWAGPMTGFGAIRDPYIPARADRYGRAIWVPGSRHSASQTRVNALKASAGMTAECLFLRLWASAGTSGRLEICMNTLREDSLWPNFLLLAGRVLMGWIFVESGFRKLTGMDAFIASLANRRVPYASVLGWIGAAAEFFGGLALPPRAGARCAARAMIVFVILATLIGHRHWELTEPAARRMQQSHFAKNVTIIGGFVLLLVTGGGRWSVDGWRRRT